MWKITRPNGTSYTRANLQGLKAAYGADKKGLEAQGWKFAKIKREEDYYADDQ